MKKITILILLLIFSNQSKSQTIKYVFDNLNRITQVIYPDSCSIKYTYDASGNRMSSLTQNICYTKPRPTITLNGNAAFCFGDSVILTSSNSTKYYWSTGDSTKQITVKKSGKYAVTAIYSSSCSKFSDSVSITVNPLPIAKITPSGNTIFCDGDSIRLQADTSRFYSYKWSTGQTTSSIIAKTSDLYKLIVTSASGCQDSTSISITVNPLPSPIAGINQTICEGPNSQVQIGSPPIDGYTYRWTPINGLSDPNIANPFANPSSTTSYTVNVTNSFSCSKISNPVIITVNPHPIAQIIASADTVFCDGDSIKLQAKTSDSYTYKWSTGANSSFIIVKATGIYKLLVTNAYGCTDSSKISIRVNPLPIPIAGINQTICQGINSQVQIGSPPIEGYKYSWLPVIGLNNPNISNPYANPSVTTTYRVTVTNTFSCSKISSPVTITVNPHPNAYISPSGNTTFCDGDSITLKAETSSSYSYKWSNGSTTSSIIVKTTGNYKLWVTNNFGCVDSTNISIMVNPLPLAIAGPNKTICEGPTSQVQIGSTPVEGCTYRWLPITGLNNPNIANPFANPAMTTQYKVTVTNSFLCSKVSNPVTITVNPRPVAHINPLGSTVFCAGDSLKLQADYSDMYSYQWSTGEKSSTITVRTTGIYKLTVTNNFGCVETTNILITVNPLPIVITGPDLFLCECPNSQVQIGADPVEGYTYIWTPSNGLSDATISNPIANPLFTTIYTLKVINEFGCTASKKVTLTRVPLPTVDAGVQKVINRGVSNQLGGNPTASGNGPFMFLWLPKKGLDNATVSNPIATPDTNTTYSVHVSDRYGCVDSSKIFIQVIPKDKRFIFYPNPTSGIIEIRGADVENGTWKLNLFNLDGAIIFKNKEIQVINNSMFYELSIKYLNKAIYILQLEKDNYRESAKILKYD